MIDLAAWGYAAVPPHHWTKGPSEATHRPGRVVRVDRGECDVVTGDGLVRVFSDSHRAQGEVAPVTGDWVEIGVEAGLGIVINRVLPRRTRLSRRDPAEHDLEQVLASNIDYVAAVHGLDRPLPPGRLERLVVLAMDSGATPVVILTKNDARMGNETEQIVRAVARDIPVIATSTVERSGLAELRALVGPTQTLVLVGASGVGKSALVNALVGEDRLEIGAVRPGDAKGRHTTTARQLVMVPQSTAMFLDTPGLRAVGLWEAEHALGAVFGDLVDLAHGCRFRDCSHDQEPACAVNAAAAAGAVDAVRVGRFRALAQELDDQREREQSPRRRPDKRRRGRRLGGAVDNDGFGCR